MYRWAFMTLLLIGNSGASAKSQPLIEGGKAFNPYSETAIAITGPVIISTKRIVFETGGLLDLDILGQEVSGKWGASGNLPVAQVFHVSGDAGPLRQENTLCGDQPVTFMAAWNQENFGFQYLGIAMFTGAEMPTGVTEESICGTYFFSLDAVN